MNAAWLIAKKRDGGELAGGEIAELIDGYTRGDVPDYQMAAWAMAVYLRGMTAAETAALTEAMLRSGVAFAWIDRSIPYVGKHSTGGVGDKTSIVLAPALACCGVRVPKLSGRGLGATGGTLDKLESIPGFRTSLGVDETQAIADRVGCVIAAASDQVAPADRKLYALRDVTATVPSIPLITASIMSKKLSESLDALVLDVKHGSGAFMKTREDAESLAESLVAAGRRMGVATSALLTDMNQPLGRAVGAALEVNEAVACLQGEGPKDLRELTIALGAEVLRLAGVCEDLGAARARLTSAIDSGAALEKLREMTRAQGGDLDAPRPLKTASDVNAPRSGRLAAVDTEALGRAVIELGGGRKRLGDAIDHGVGLEALVRLGDEIEEGQPLTRLYARDANRAAAVARVQGAFQIDDQAVDPPPLILGRVPRSDRR